MPVILRDNRHFLFNLDYRFTLNQVAANKTTCFIG